MMGSTQSPSYMQAILIALVLLASIICGLIIVICAIVLCKFCYERNQRTKNVISDNKDSRTPTDEKRMCRKLLGQSEISKPTEKLVLKALDSDLDSGSESNHSYLISTAVQTDESSFLAKSYESVPKTTEGISGASGAIKPNPFITSPGKRQIIPMDPNRFTKMTHPKSRVKVQIQNYIAPITDHQTLQIAQSVVRRYSDNSPYKDEEALEAEAYSRGRSASQTPQSNKMSPTPSEGILPHPFDNRRQSHCLIAPINQRRGSHHLRPFDTHWGNNKLSHSMEIVPSNPPIQAEERKVHSFDNALGRRRVLSSQGAVFHVKSLTMSNSDDVVTSSLEESYPQTTSLMKGKGLEMGSRGNRDHQLLPDEIRIYTLSSSRPGSQERKFLQQSYQNILEHPVHENYRARKSYVGEFNTNPEYFVYNRRPTDISSPHRERKSRRKERKISSRNQSQISSKDSITINIIDSDAEPNNPQSIESETFPKLSMFELGSLDGSRNSQQYNAAARRRQFSRERQSLIQPADIAEIQQMYESRPKSPGVRDPDRRMMQRQSFSRDYSIDERTNAIFNEFVRDDPNLDRDVMEAQIREKIRTQRKSTATPVNKGTERSRSRMENKKAASFAGNEEFPTPTQTIDFDDSTYLSFQKYSGYQQRKQSIGRMKVQSFDQRIQLPVIILPDDSP